MATFLDITGIEKFSVIFPFLLVFVVVYGILEATGVFGKDKQGMHSLVAFVLAMIAVISPGFVDVIKTSVPWFVILVIFIFMSLLSFRVFGTTNADVLGVLKGNRTITSWIVAISIIILIYSVSQVYGQQLLNKDNTDTGNVTTGDGSTGSNNFSDNVGNTLFHPKILGMMLLFLVATFSVMFLTKRG